MATVKEITDQLQGGKWKFLVFFAAVIVVIMIIMDGFVSIPAGHVGVVFDLGRGVLEDELGEGLHLKVPFWQDVTVLDARTQEYTMSIAPGEGAIMSDDSIESRSKDGQVVWVDATILFHIDATQADNIKSQLGTELDYYTKIIRPKAREVVRSVVARYNSLDLVSELRPDIVKDMYEELKNDYGVHDILLEEVMLRNVTYSVDFANAIEQKEVARQQIKTAEYQKDQAEQFKQKKIIEAEADAASITLKGDALRNNPEVIQLEFVNKLSPNVSWGILPDSITPFFNVPGL
ncbi:prohibitin family protein [Patescibacteria group bacterium]|nr:prohibitin family protein [Patescibacteria group bacterium]